MSAKHFTVGPKMAEMRVVSPSWQGPLSIPAPHEVSAHSCFAPPVDPRKHSAKRGIKSLVIRSQTTAEASALKPKSCNNNTFKNILLFGLFQILTKMAVLILVYKKVSHVMEESWQTVSAHPGPLTGSLIRCAGAFWGVFEAEPAVTAGPSGSSSHS